MDTREYAIMARVEETHPWFVNRRRLIRGLIRRFAAHRTRPRILDAGSGTGVNLTDYAQIGWVVGVEFDSQATIISRARGTSRLAVGDLARLPFAQASFDLVIATDVIEHIEHDVAALRAMARVLVPAGRILLTTPAYAWAYSQHDRQLHHVRRYDSSRLRWAFRQAGLRVLHSARYNVLLAAPVLISRLLQDPSQASDVGRPIPWLVAPVLDSLWHLEASLAQRINLGVGLTHLAVLARV